MNRQEQDDLARAVSARDLRFRRYKDGKYVEALWNPGVMDKPYAVYLADDGGVYRTLAFDFDRTGADKEAREFLGELESLSIPAMFCASGSGEGRHVIFTVPDGIDAATARKLADGIRARFSTLDKSMLCNPGTGAIRPPGAPHRYGGESVLVGCSLLEALEILEEGTTPDRVGLLLSRFPATGRVKVRDLPPSQSDLVRIPERVRTRMRNGELGDFSSRSELIQSLACSYILAGASRLQFARDLLSPTNAAGAKLREMVVKPGVRAAKRWLATSWENARTFLEGEGQDPRDDLREEEKVLAGLVFGTDFAGKQGFSDRMVLAAHGSIALNVGRLVYQASDRQLAERAGISRQAVNRSHKRLIKRGLLRRIEAGKETEASTWHLLPSETKESSPHSPSSLSIPNFPLLGCVLLGTDRDTPDLTVSFEKLLDALGHDAFRHGGLGKPAQIIWGLLSDSPMTAKEIEEQLGIGRSTTQKALKELARHGLVDQTADGWIGVPGDLDQVAENVGTAGRGAADKALHENEREGYRNAYDRFVTQEREKVNEQIRRIGKQKVERTAHQGHAENRPEEQNVLQA